MSETFGSSCVLFSLAEPLSAAFSRAAMHSQRRSDGVSELPGGQRVLPDKAQASGFAFRYPTLRVALSAMLGTHTAHPGGRAARARRPRYFGGRARARGLSLRASLAKLAARHRLSDDRLLR